MQDIKNKGNCMWGWVDIQNSAQLFCKSKSVVKLLLLYKIDLHKSASLR